MVDNEEVRLYFVTGTVRSYYADIQEEYASIDSQSVMCVSETEAHDKFVALWKDRSTDDVVYDVVNVTVKKAHF